MIPEARIWDDIKLVLSLAVQDGVRFQGLWSQKKTQVLNGTNENYIHAAELFSTLNAAAFVVQR